MKNIGCQKNLILLLLCIMSFGCRKNDVSTLLWEINPDSDNPVIQKEAKNIEFEFSILNKAGQPSAVFNEGDNIIFSFSFMNLNTDSVIVSTEFINYNFYRVYSAEDDKDMGKPWSGLWCLFNLGPEVIELAPDSSKTLSCPWIKTDKEQPVYPLCMAESMPPIPKGDYYTFINLDFHYSLNGEETIIDQITFKISFKVI